MRVGSKWFVAVTFVGLAAVACSKPSGDASPGASATPAVVKPAPAPAAPAVRNAAGKLTKAGVAAAWDAVFRDGRVSDPIEKKHAAFEAKVGKPVAVEKDTKIWFAVDGADCFKIELGKDGTKSDEKVDAAKCGS
jgi:hypothetical protein